MSVTRRRFLCSSGQMISTASLLVTTPLLPAEAVKSAVPTIAPARDILVRDVNGLALFLGAGCNVLGLAGADGALLVDGGLAVNSALLLKKVHGNLKTKRVQTLLNTHWHPEQTGSNEAVGKSGGALISHEVTKLFLGRAARSAVFEGTYGPLPDIARPKTTTYNTGSLEFASEKIDYRYLPAAHTNGDLCIHFLKHNVIAAGGPVSAVRWPVIDYLNGGFMHGFLRSYEILVEIANDDTVIVPAEGPVMKKADLLRHQKMYQELFKFFFVGFNKGYGPQDIIDERPLKGHEAELGEPAAFLEAAYRSVQLATIPH